MSEPAPVVEIRDIRKHFGATRALDGVSLDVHPGEVHGILGENGAGKSTLNKILAGVLMPDSGKVLVEGAEMRLGHPLGSRAAGLAMAYQELSAPPNITVAEKLFLPKLPLRFGLVWRRRLYDEAQDVLTRWGKPGIRASALISGLDLADRQHVEIIAAMATRPKLLILDEPTAALPNTDWLFDCIRELAGSGTGIIYITHKLAEIRTICTRGTVMRNGRVVSEFDPRQAGEQELVELMIGRSLNQAFPAKPARTGAEETVVSVKNLGYGRELADVSLQCRAGEIVGVAGLEGQGQKALFYTLAGFLKPHRGNISVTSDSDKGKRKGFTLVPEDRKTEGLFLSLATRVNLTIPGLKRVSPFGTIMERREKQLAETAAGGVNLSAALLGKPVQSLSGGNQQKVLLGRALLESPSCLLLFDPTRGVDAATKVELYHLIREYSAQGGSAIVYSTEIPELVGLCDRVYTLYDGRISGEFTGDALTENNLMTGALGGTLKHGDGSHVSPGQPPMEAAP